MLRYHKWVCDDYSCMALIIILTLILLYSYSNKNNACFLQPGKSLEDA